MRSRIGVTSEIKFLIDMKSNKLSNLNNPWYNENHSSVLLFQISQMPRLCQLIIYKILKGWSQIGLHTSFPLVRPVHNMSDKRTTQKISTTWEKLQNLKNEYTSSTSAIQMPICNVKHLILGSISQLIKSHRLVLPSLTVKYKLLC